MSSTTTQGLWTEGYGEIGATLRALQDAGVTRSMFKLLRSDPLFAQGVGEDIAARWKEAVSVDSMMLRVIMGNNIFGVEEWEEFYGVKFSPEDAERLKQCPWGKHVLKGPCPFADPRWPKRLKETHFAFVGCTSLDDQPLTIRRWYERSLTGGTHGYTFFPRACQHESFANLPLNAEQTPEVRWYLMPIKGAVHNYCDYCDGGDCDGQMARLDANYMVPSAVEAVTMCLLYYTKTQQLALPYDFVRTSSIPREGTRIMIGTEICTGTEGDHGMKIENPGLRIHVVENDKAWIGYGMAGSRRLPEL